MIIKKYLVSNMNEALTRIRNELGKNAVIISQRKVRQEGIKGYFSPKLVEVTAAIENSKKIKNTNIKEDVQMEESINSIKKIMEENLKEKAEQVKEEEGKKIEQVKVEDKKKIEQEKVEEKKDISNKEVENLKNEISDIKEILNKALGIEEKTDYLLDAIKELDIFEEYYDEFKEKLEQINSKEEILEILKELILKDLKVDTENLKGKIVLVGPTGVGKTTTIAKLAGKLALKERKSVGLITVDTYRIGAVEQLKTYAEIMDIDFKVVLTPKEMEAAIEEMKDLDVILIDSTGRSSKNTMQIGELRNLVNRVKADSTYLVLSATTKNKDLKTIIEGYGQLDYNKIILTKLDETTSYGSIYNVQKLSGKPIKYLTVGQNVPDDILDATKENMLKFVFMEETV